MQLLSVDSVIVSHNYVMAQKNNIDLKYLSSPAIEISEEYLNKLPYSYLDEEGPDLRKAANESFKYHHDRTEKNIAHRIKDRQARIAERDNDPFYWLAIFYKAQQQLKQTLTLNYRNSGFSVVKKQNVIKSQIDIMDDALVRIKGCPGFGTVFKLQEVPNEITIHNDMVLPQSQKAMEVEAKYLKFCQMYNIDFKYVSEVNVFDNSGAPIDEYYIKQYARETRMIRSEWLDTKGRILTDEPRFYNFKDSAQTLIYYHLFMDCRLSLRNVIAKYMEQGLAGTLSEAQLENLQKYVDSSEKAYRLMTLSKYYKVGFQVSDSKEYETISYNGMEVKEEEKNSNVSSKDADDALLTLHKNSMDLQSKIEQEKRVLEEIRRKQQELDDAKAKLAQEELKLNSQYVQLETSIKGMESEYANLQEEIARNRK